MMSDPERNARTSRILLIAGAVVAVISVITWFTVGSSGSKHKDDPKAGTCQLPSGAKSGVTTLPALVGTLTTPLGAPNTMWTKTSGDTTYYSYCYNLIDGQHLNAAIGLLTGHGYTPASGDDPTIQTNYTKPDSTPYAVSLTVQGDLDISRVDPLATGGLAIVWTNTKPPT